jgi:hypothetical protein
VLASGDSQPGNPLLDGFAFAGGVFGRASLRDTQFRFIHCSQQKH